MKAGTIKVLLIVALTVVGCASTGSPEATRPPSVTGSTETVAPPVTANPGPGRDVLALFDTSQPLFLTGRQVDSLSAASVATGKVILAPTDPSLPSPEVWVNADSGEVGLRYAADLVVLQTPWPVRRPVGRENPYRSKADSLGAGTLTEVAGYPAFVLPANSRQTPDGSQPPVNIVQVDIEGFDVTLMSPSVSPDELLRLAASIESSTGTKG